MVNDQGDGAHNRRNQRSSERISEKKVRFWLAWPEKRRKLWVEKESTHRGRRRAPGYGWREKINLEIWASGAFPGVGRAVH